ncbi:MAG: hypothetical protein JF597_49840 [Streptomyces sp.]|uniref:hypothetical protein n=1 Tax=Streptomyces sp. TaxID=1931 RepID=UPI0025D0A7EA|nr:hypothetical protein [Streptomyces sp.]MBW8801369.1 hypothetical protein [Streptomyces sp.]
MSEEQVVLPPTKEEVLAEWRARRRAARAAEAEVAVETALPTETVIPAARAPEEALDPYPESRRPVVPLEVAPRLLSVGAAAMFVSAFALGESVMALNLFS